MLFQWALNISIVALVRLLNRSQQPNMKLARRFSITNFLIASSALGFQVFVLYPWHTKLDDEFQELRRANLVVLKQLETLTGKAAPLSPAKKE